MSSPSGPGAGQAAAPQRGRGLDGRRQALLQTTRQALERQDLAPLVPVLNRQHASDLAQLFRNIDERQQQQVLQILAEPLAADVLAEMDTALRLEVAEGLDESLLSDLVEEMEPDDAADVLGGLSEEQSQKILGMMGPAEADEVRGLLVHPEDTGGGIMTPRLVSLREDQTVRDAIQQLHQRAEEEEDIACLYAVDADGALVGVIPLKRLLLNPPSTPLGALMRRDPISVRTDDDQEEVARVFTEYNLLALPVVDDMGRLVGRVTADDIVDIIQEEATEDIYGMAAIVSSALEASSVTGIMRRRLPWLLVCLIGTLLSGLVLDAFSQTLVQAGALVLFVPAIMAMGGNTGSKTSTVTVRSLATGHLQSGQTGMAILKEVRIALGMGKFFGVLVFAAAYVWTGSPAIAACVGLAMLAAVVLSAGLGAVVPLLFRSLGIDPAVASGPLITTLNDAISLLIYFSIAVHLLERWG